MAAGYCVNHGARPPSVTAAWAGSGCPYSTIRFIPDAHRGSPHIQQCTVKSAWTNSTRSIVAVVVLTASIACQKHYPPFPRAAEHKIAAFLSDSEPSPPAYDSLFVYFVEGWETYQEPEGTHVHVIRDSQAGMAQQLMVWRDSHEYHH